MYLTAEVSSVSLLLNYVYKARMRLYRLVSHLVYLSLVIPYYFVTITFQRHYHNFVQKLTLHLVNSAPLHGEGSLPIDMSRK